MVLNMLNVYATFNNISVTPEYTEKTTCIPAARQVDMLTNFITYNGLSSTRAKNGIRTHNFLWTFFLYINGINNICNLLSFTSYSNILYYPKKNK